MVTKTRSPCEFLVTTNPVPSVLRNTIFLFSGNDAIGRACTRNAFFNILLTKLLRILCCNILFKRCLVNLIFLLSGTGILLKRVSSCFPNSCLEFAGVKTSNINIRIFIGLQQTLFSRGGCTLPFLFWLAPTYSAEHQCNDPKESTSLTFLQHWPPNPPCCPHCQPILVCLFLRSTMSYLILTPGERIELS